MLKKKLFSLLLVMAMVIGLVACGGSTTTQPAAEAQAVEETTAEAKAEATQSVNLEILKEQDDSMINTYTLLAVNDAAPFVDANGAEVKDVVLNKVLMLLSIGCLARVSI